MAHPEGFIGPIQKAHPPTQISNAQKRCEGKGGVWDEETKTCKLPTPTTTSPEREKELFGGVGVEPQVPLPTKIIRDEGGRISGVELPSGRTLLGLSKQDIETITGKAEGEVVGAEEVAEQERVSRRIMGLEERRPVRRELDPFRFEEEKFPIFGGAFSAMSNLAKRIAKRIGLPTEGEEFIKPEELRTMALTQIEKEEIEAGLTASEEFGAFVEGIGDVPFLGKTITWGADAEKPSENVQTILRELKAEKTRATNLEMKVKDGTLSMVTGREMINDVDLNIQRMESRIKLLIFSSPDLKFNSDGVNFIEIKILEARERVFFALINVERGEATDPSELAMLTALQGTITAEDFTIPGL